LLVSHRIIATKNTKAPDSSLTGLRLRIIFPGRREHIYSRRFSLLVNSLKYFFSKKVFTNLAATKK